jgi:O-acetyl-ADP-ribose deacetylase (regulator of RNase III)
MPITYLSGDLFANIVSAEAFAHGCNCQGSMGAGIAVEFKRRYPAMFEIYRAMCKADPRQLHPGDCFFWRSTDDQPHVFNLATQEHYWRSRATYDAVRAALNAMRQRADTEGVTSIAMPRIGAGHGGLSWKKVRAIIDEVFGDWNGSLYVYGIYVQQGEIEQGGM